uniref:Uncharacterized protein n=1 Tax=Glossina palpalis gambiensis TaxID=67801 RepID=A0A1B0BRD6_9MUSC
MQMQAMTVAHFIKTQTKRFEKVLLPFSQSLDDMLSGFCCHRETFRTLDDGCHGRNITNHKQINSTLHNLTKLHNYVQA